MPQGILKPLKSLLDEHKLDSLLLRTQTNIRYLTDFPGEGAYLALNRDRAILYVSPLYIEEARTTVKAPIEVVDACNGMMKTMAVSGSEFWGERVGFESAVTVYDEYERLKTALSYVEFVPVLNMVESLRMFKTSQEIAAITRAQRIAERVLENVVNVLKEGVSERDIALEIDYGFRKEGGERSSFDTIVAFGNNSSKPHALPSERRLKYGDIVLFDMGTVVDGYASDMTRTFFFGTPDDRYRTVYQTVLNAQNAALDGLHAGMTCRDADALARDVIEQAGFGDKFVHSLGHGVGLDIHEMPRLSTKDETVLENGMVVTVEPGIYFPGWGGVRIEDMAVIDDTGCTNLTCAPKQLIAL